MTESFPRWPRFPLWSVFALTTVVAVLVAACAGWFGLACKIIAIALVVFLLAVALQFIAAVLFIFGDDEQRQ